MLRKALICLGSQKDSIFILGLLLISCETGECSLLFKIRALTTVLKTLSDLRVGDLVSVFHVSEYPQTKVTIMLTLGVS